jgi:hypothetical protein
MNVERESLTDQRLGVEKAIASLDADKEEIARDKANMKAVSLSLKEKEEELKGMENDLIKWKEKLNQQKQRQDNAK